MKLLGIDYGSKRVGIATSDTLSGLAFPKSVILNDKHLIKTITNLCNEIKVDKIILGESKNLDGSDNEISKSIRDFKQKLEEELGLEIILEPEFYSTYGATRIQGDSDMIDASAAAIILQSYIDKIKATNN